MAHPSRKTTTELKMFNTDLFPDLKGDLPFEWLIRNFTVSYTADVSRVEALVRRFISDFVRYINQCGTENVPEAIKACKRRSAQLIDLCQELIGVNEQGYQIVPLTKDAELIKSNYKIRFAKKFAIIGESEDDSYIMDIDITSNPRCYRSLFDAAIIGCYLPNPDDRNLLWILLQTVGELYKSVKLTDQEILDVEKEFLDAAQDDIDTFSESEAERLLDIMEKDMRSSNPPLYCADLAKARRAIDGYLYNHSYDIDDASYSTSSSGSKLVINGVNIPNMALIFSAIETDVSLDVDKALGYKSYYTTESFPGLQERPTVSKHVPKTSSRGERWIHLNSNGRQDRGNIIDSCMEHVLKNVIKCDCTFDQPSGFIAMYQKILADINHMLVIAGTDMKASTDWIDHKALIRIWKIFFREDIPEFLLWLHSGEGIIELHDENMHRVEKTYTQIRGIKCGTRSNFAVGLALIHHVVMRLTMLKLQLQDKDPEDYYRVLGDDNNHFLRKDDFLPVHQEGLPDWRLWLETYTSIAYDVGFRVHPIDEKGTLSIAGEGPLTKGEFAKQTWSNYGMVSGIPYKLFWASLREKNNLLPIILWLTQYNVVKLDSTRLMKVAMFLCPQRPMIFADVWDFACNNELYGLNKKMRFNSTYQCGYSDRQIAILFFEDFLNNTVMDTLINNRSRLSRTSQVNKIAKYCLLVEDDTLIDPTDEKKKSQIRDELDKIHQVTNGLPIIDYLIEWNRSTGAPMSKLEYCIEKNQRFSDSLKDITDNPFVVLSASLGIFNERDQQIIKRALPYVRFSNYSIPGEDPVEILMSARNLLKEKQPISISKRTHRSSKFMTSVINNLSLEIPENLSQETIE